MKRFFLIMLILVMLSNNAYASNLTAQHEHAINVLKKIGLVDTEWEYSYDCNLTRRACLKYLCRISGGLYDVPDDKLLSEEYFGVPDFFDIDGGTEDCRLVISAYINGILKGKILPDGKRIADLDSIITWKEAITMIDRLFISNIYIDKTTSDTFWYTFACDKGIISDYSHYNVYNVFQLDITQQDNYVAESDFLYVFYTAIHIPKYENTYRGDITSFYIDDFIKEEVQ